MDNNLFTVRKISQVVILKFLLCYQKKKRKGRKIQFHSSLQIHLSVALRKTMKYSIKADKSGCPLEIIEPKGEIKLGKKMGSLLYPNFKMVD